MPIATKGQIHTRPFGIRTSATHQQLFAAFSALSGQVEGEGGWGGFTDDPELRGMLGVRTLSVSPVVQMPEDAYAPQRIVGRLYWWALDRDALRIKGGDVPPEELQRLDACDFLISQAAGSEYLCLVTTRNDGDLRAHVVPALERIVNQVDPAAMITWDSTPLDIINPDFFFWLMYRYHGDQELSSNLAVRNIRDVSGQDIAMRGSSVKDGITLDRAELLAMIMKDTTDFGPASVVMVDSQLELELDVQIYLDGGFSPSVSRSSYYGPDDRPTRDVLGIRLLENTVYKVIPEAVGAYNADSQWQSSGRAEYVARAREMLREVMDEILAGP